MKSGLIMYFIAQITRATIGNNGSIQQVVENIS